MGKSIVKMSNITKAFGGNIAVNKCHFDLEKGEIHSLIGENGTGKSTMMNLLYGMHQPDSGKIELFGNEYSELSTYEAIELGVGMVHQEFMLIDELTVLENIVLGFETRKNKFQIDYDKARKEIQKYIEEYDFDVQLDKKVRDISMGEAQRVEIIKTLYRGAEILILDEPTAVLTPQESEKLFDIIFSLKADNKSIVFISHKLNEVLTISDRITVMRRGKYIGTVNKSETTRSGLVQMMLDREVFERTKNNRTFSNNSNEILLSVEGVYIPGERELSKIKDVSFTVNKGEILGIAGIDGNGQKELIEGIVGIRNVQKGHIRLLENDITNKSIADIRTSGMAHIPEDRNLRGLNRVGTIEANLTALNIDKEPLSNKGMINFNNTESFSKELIKRFDIRPDDPSYSTTHLSGGNAQKVVVAREMYDNKPLLIAAHPTRGVDIGSIEQIHEYIIQAVAEGTGVILISADLEEILNLSDRIIVMYEGKIVGELPIKDANQEYLGEMMMGGSSQK